MGLRPDTHPANEVTSSTKPPAPTNVLPAEAAVTSASPASMAMATVKPFAFTPVPAEKFPPERVVPAPATHVNSPATVAVNVPVTVVVGPVTQSPVAFSVAVVNVAAYVIVMSMRAHTPTSVDADAGATSTIVRTAPNAAPKHRFRGGGHAVHFLIPPNVFMPLLRVNRANVAMPVCAHGKVVVGGRRVPL